MGSTGTTTTRRKHPRAASRLCAKCTQLLTIMFTDAVTRPRSLWWSVNLWLPLRKSFDYAIRWWWKWAMGHIKLLHTVVIVVADIVFLLLPISVELNAIQTYFRLNSDFVGKVPDPKILLLSMTLSNNNKSSRCFVFSFTIVSHVHSWSWVTVKCKSLIPHVIEFNIYFKTGDNHVLCVERQKGTFALHSTWVLYTGQLKHDTATEDEWIPSFSIKGCKGRVVALGSLTILTIQWANVSIRPSSAPHW